MQEPGNGKNRMNQWLVTLFGVISLAGMGWVTWITINVADYVSGEKRGERATMNEFRLELARNNIVITEELHKAIGSLELRFQKLSDDFDRQWRKP